MVEQEVQHWRRLFIAAALLTVPVFLLTVVVRPMSASFLGFPLTPLLKWAFTTPVQVRSNARRQDPGVGRAHILRICSTSAGRSVIHSPACCTDAKRPGTSST